MLYRLLLRGCISIHTPARGVTYPLSALMYQRKNHPKVRTSLLAYSKLHQKTTKNPAALAGCGVRTSQGFDVSLGFAQSSSHSLRRTRFNSFLNPRLLICIKRHTSYHSSSLYNITLLLFHRPRSHHRMIHTIQMTIPL